MASLNKQIEDLYDKAKGNQDLHNHGAIAKIKYELKCALNINNPEEKQNKINELSQKLDNVLNPE